MVDMDGVYSLVIFVVAAAIYFIPTIVASRKDHKNSGAIAVLNLLTGWTFIGWVVALVWASTDSGTPTTTPSWLQEANQASNAESAPDKYSQVERLARLRDNNAITEEQFEQERNKLLGS
ncbi:superinfection immunity protein [Kushneria phosphatilytica]|uniref:Superinfection immunity protein n=1 Tax=Kushneria phosphatilytica TaxID=657387 RepID=A0A5C1A3I9_9GAMM|nr:superinfection immunity protein [Kushneria phosphatilytica]QEL12806.1 superinfection immunity protein [Kushneria phosphatilytica]